MYKAWICYPGDAWGQDDDEEPVVLFYEPREHMYGKVIPIAFYKLKEFDPDATSF